MAEVVNGKSSSRMGAMSIGKYALKSFRHNAGKGVIFAIALSVMLLITVLNIATSLQRTIYEEAVSVGGDAHAVYNLITTKQVEQLASHEAVQWSDMWLSLNAWGAVAGENENAVTIVYSSRMGLMEGSKLEAGRAPEAENEVALAPHLARALGIEPKVGESFTFPVYTFDSATEYDFVISGILQEQPYHERAKSYTLYVSEPFILKHGSFSEQPGREFVGHGKHDMRMMFVHFKDGYFPIETAKELAVLAGVGEGYYSVNEIYIYADLDDPVIIIAVTVILLVLMAAGALVISNVFSMMHARRTRSFGLLTLIGASKQQLRRVVYIEALLNTAVALPIGFVLGSLFSYFGSSLIQGAMNEMFIPVYHISPWSYAITIALAAVMTLVGVARPALKASRIAPVEAVRFAGVIEKVNTRRKQKEYITIPVLSRINMQRHKGRTVNIILSLTLSGMLILAVSIVGLGILSSADVSAQNQISGDIRLIAGDRYTYQQGSDALSEDIIETLKSMDGIENIKTFMSNGYCKSFTRSGDILFPDNSGEIIGVEEPVLRELMELVAVGEPSFNELLDGTSVLAVNSDFTFTREYNYELGQSVEVYLIDERGYATENTATLRVAGVINFEDMPEYELYGGLLPSLIMVQSSFEQNGFFTELSNILIDVTPEAEDTLISAVRELCNQKGNLYFEAYQLFKQQFEQEVSGVLSLVMMVLAIITIVAVLNLVSSTFIGIQQRQREFGILASLGLSPKGLREVLVREGITISAVSILASVILGIGGGYGAIYFFENVAGSSNMDFTFPTVPFIALLLVYGFVPYLAMTVAVRRLSHQTTVELLGQET